MATLAPDIKTRLQRLANPADARFLQRYFKTGPGEYGEGDVFLGIRVPVLRKVTREFSGATIEDGLELLKSTIHEERSVALMIWCRIAERGTDGARKRLYDLYLANTKWINNWDLIDGSAPRLVGGWLQERPRKVLDKLAKSSSLWERRISILATHWFIKQKDFADTVRIAEVLLHDEHDLIHKAVGWMLREVGQRDRPVMEEFLAEHHGTMPRTMLRYAIEKLPEERRQEFLKGRVTRKVRSQKVS